LAGLFAAVPTLDARAAVTCDDPVPPQSLKRIATKNGLTVGSAITVEQLNDDDMAFLVRQVSSLTPENAMKMTALRPSRTEWKFERADAIVDFALRKAMQIRGHTLIWNNDQQPDWINSLSTNEMKGVAEEHIEQTMSRYLGRVKTWDVVNEPVGSVAYGDLTLREGPFLARLGVDYIANSFRRARSVDPTAKLVLNETHTERDDSFGHLYRKGLLSLLDHLLDQGVPLDGVGLQGHIQSDVPFDPEAYAAFLDEIAHRGLFIEITELDVNDKSFPDDILARDLKVAEAYKRFLNVALANKAVRSISFWQLGDRASFYYFNAVYSQPSASRRPRPLLFDLSMRPKPAFNAVIEALQQAHRT
jgi:endo-1,4-beta-xylanase